MNLSLYITPLTKINSKLISDINIRLEIVKLLIENTRKNTPELGLDNEFFGYDKKAQVTKAKINQWDYIK